MQLIDTNVILRFILNDNPEMAKRAAKVIASGAYTKPEVIAEVVYAIDLFASTSLDFVDCLLAAYHSLNGEIVFTFDKKLNKHLNTDTI